MEPKRSLKSSQKGGNGPHREPDESNQHSRTLYPLRPSTETAVPVENVTAVGSWCLRCCWQATVVTSRLRRGWKQQHPLLHTKNFLKQLIAIYVVDSLFAFIKPDYLSCLQTPALDATLS
jgi:hypothetical protein